MDIAKQLKAVTQLFVSPAGLIGFWLAKGTDAP